MSFRASIETDIDDYLRVLHTDGSHAGNALLSFLTPLAVYCTVNDNPEIQQWVSDIDAYGSISLCRLLLPLIQAHYCGDWRYRDDEYSIYCARYPDNTLTEAAFKQTLQQIDNKWTNAKDILSNINELLLLLAQAHPKSTWWYDAKWTRDNLEALADTLTLAIERGAEQVRIQFT
jgi:hypothetical protein